MTAMPDRNRLTEWQLLRLILAILMWVASVITAVCLR